MRRFSWAEHLLPMLCLLLLPGSLQAASRPRVLIVPIHGNAGVAFDTGIVRFVEPQLARHARPVPLPTAKLAYRKAQVTPNGAKRDYHDAQKLGRAAGAQYLLLLEAVGRPPALRAHSVLIDVRTARAVAAGYLPLAGGRLTAPLAARLVAMLVPRLKSAQPAVARGETEPQREALAGSVDPTEPESVYRTAELDDVDRRLHRRARGPMSQHDDRWRPGLRVSLGPLFLQRVGHIDPATPPPANVTTPCYCGTDRNSNPYFVGGLLAAEVYPLALLHNGDSLLEGLGAHLELGLSGPETIIDADSQQTIRSTLLDFKIGAQFRYVLWDSPLATDVQLDGGLTMFNFPLRAGGFPGVAYRAGYLGLSAHAPLGLPELVLLGGGHVVFATRTGDSAASWLGQQEGGTGFNLHAGLRYQIGHWEIGGQYRLEMYRTGFSGATAFPDSAKPANQSAVTQLENVTLRDQLNEFSITGSFVF